MTQMEMDENREAQPFSRKGPDEERDKKEYEISFLVREENGGEAVRNLITRHGGTISSASPVRRIALAYKVEKEAYAHFGFFRAELSPSALAPLRNDLTTSGAALRFLIVIPPKHMREDKREPRGPSPAEAPKAPQESRDTLPLSNEALERKIEEILQ